MKSRILFAKLILIISISILSSFLFNSCYKCTWNLSDICVLSSSNIGNELTDSSKTTVLEAPDTLIIFHGSACAKINKDGFQDILLMHGSQELPPYVTEATVFLNGWGHSYLNSDHHVAKIGIMIKNISFDNGKSKFLKWDAVGGLADGNFDDPYSMCYNYTVVAWNSANIDINIDQNDGNCDTSNLVESNFFIGANNGTSTALSSFPTFLESSNFIPGNTVAILPRGFAFSWNSCDDHHLIQIGYNLEHNEDIMKDQDYNKGITFFNPLLPKNSSRVDSGFTSWETYAVFKDENDRRDYGFGEIVSGMSGSDVRIIQPPFSILPNGGGGACNGSILKEAHIIERIPFEYAVPVLSGWELGYLCSDHHIQDLGISIDEWSYTKNPVTNLGTLTYKLSSAFNDDNDDDPNYSNHKVTILGFRPIAPGKIAGGKFADLIPFSPVGTFCRREPSGKQWRVTIRNQGSADASASKTSILFGNIKVTLDTPLIPAGGSTDLLFTIPNSCFDPDCEFIIEVDSENNVNEEDGEGNNKANGICVG